MMSEFNQLGKEIVPVSAQSFGLKMSSREIATLTGKEHFHVKRDIEKMFSELGEDASIFGCIYLDSLNRQKTEYQLDRRYVDCLLTGYSAVLRMKVIDRWQELEAVNQRPAIPQTLGEALRYAADIADDRDRTAAQLVETRGQLAIAEIKGQYADEITRAEGAHSLRDTAKALHLSPIPFNRYLRSISALVKQSGENVATQRFIDAGYFRIVTALDGNNKARVQTLVTELGKARIWARLQKSYPDMTTEQINNELKKI